MRYFVFYTYYDESMDEMTSEFSEFSIEREALDFINNISGGHVCSARIIHGTEIKIKKTEPQWTKDE